MPVCGCAGSAVEILSEHFFIPFSFFLSFFFYFFILNKYFSLSRWLRAEEMNPDNAVTDRHFVESVHSLPL